MSAASQDERLKSRLVEGDLGLTSWRISEWEYKKGSLPINARGLFTVGGGSQDADADAAAIVGNGRRIVLRGYDKFFNREEVPWTKREALERNCQGGFDLTVKENGCIILIGQLDGKLVVASKHSLGDHAKKGEEWVGRHLARRGIGRDNLAAFIQEHNVTLVGELCDDSFEEHVLAYEEERWGIYLHGVNENKVEFKTWSIQAVRDTAKQFGFFPVETVHVDTLQEVYDFTSRVGESSEYQGRAVEGFVVRTTHGKQSTWPTGDPFFFKIKFDEPYLMYREWRELTRRILKGKEGPSPERLESREFLRWARALLQTDPESFEGFNQGRGIIKLRNRFLEYWNNTGRGLAIQHDKEDLERTAQEKAARIPQNRWLIVPVAIPGAGKTTLGLALCELFGFSHCQNDNVTNKKTKGQFENDIRREFAQHRVVIADRNNHLEMHRAGLIKMTRNDPLLQGTQCIALYWPWTEAHSIQTISSRRIKARGLNHQSLRHDEATNVDAILWRFIKDTEPLNPELFEHVINLSWSATVRENLDTTIKALTPILNLPSVSEDEINQVIEHALAYKPTVRKEINSGSTVQYYGIEVDLDVVSYLKDILGNDNELLTHLILHDRLVKRPHITLVHRAELKNKADPLKGRGSGLEPTNVWNTVAKLKGQKLSLRLDKLIYSDKAMALTVTLPSQILCTNRYPHITIGTRDGSIKAKEANVLIEMVLDEGGQGEVIELQSRDMQGVVTAFA